MNQSPIKKPQTQTIIAALRELATSGIKSEDGVANACIWDAADRMEEMRETLEGIAYWHEQGSIDGSWIDAAIELSGGCISADEEESE